MLRMTNAVVVVIEERLHSRPLLVFACLMIAGSPRLPGFQGRFRVFAVFADSRFDCQQTVSNVTAWVYFGNFWTFPAV